jgi:hypothetical protein
VKSKELGKDSGRSQKRQAEYKDYRIHQRVHQNSGHLEKNQLRHVMEETR